MINWILTNALPKNFPSEVSQKLQTLWCQRQQLQIGQDGIQYRLWEDVIGGGSNPELQIVLPLELVFIVLTQLHDSATAEHLGIRKTLDKVQRRFYWPGRRQDVEDWCRSCSKCIARKLPVRPHHAPMQTETAGKRLQRVSVDILVLSQKQNGRIGIFWSLEIILPSGWKLCQCQIWKHKLLLDCSLTTL